MHLRLLELLCCPACRHFPLDLNIFERRALPARSNEAAETLTQSPVGGSLGAQHQILRDDDEHETGSAEIESGYLYCPSCERFYFILNGIPRLITEEFSGLIDLSLIDAWPAGFSRHGSAFRDFIGLLERGASQSAGSNWQLEDVAFWETGVYGIPRVQEQYLERVRRSSAAAGDRTYPRERHLFRGLRPHIRNDVLIDVGCGIAQTIRILCDPMEVGYHYVGADLSLNALELNRATLAGDFVQCNVEEPPFREGSAAGVLSLGTLHHLEDQQATLLHLLRLLKPGGMIAIHEVTHRSRFAARWPVLSPMGSGESAHNDAVNAEELLRLLSDSCEIVSLKHEYSVLRGLLVRWLAEAMRERVWLTSVVLAIDDLFLATAGKLASHLQARAILVLARKSGAQVALGTVR